MAYANFSSIILVMRKLFFTFIIFVFVALGVCFADENCDMRDYNGVELAKGTFIPVISAQEISTAYCDIGTKVKFISTSDLYLYETNVIPQNTELFGYVEQVNEPIVGTNASMVIKVSKLKFSDGFEIPLRGYIYASGSSIIGGELTAPSSYEQKPSYRQGCPIMTGYVPGPSRRMGEHKVIASGADLMVILVAPLYITHTVTN